MTKNTAGRMTARRIESLKPQAKVYRLTDASATPGGLLIEVRPSGGKSWISRVGVSGGYEQDENGTPRRRRARRVDIAIGQWPTVSIEEAHERHRHNAALAAMGRDPRGEKMARQLAPRFSELMEKWLDHIERNKELGTRTLDAHRRRWRLHLSRLNGVPVDQMTKQAIAPELTRIAEKAPAQARACLITLRAALEWARLQGWIENNPAADMKPDAYGAGASKPRDVVLTLPELRQVWSALDRLRLAPATVAAIRLLILTGARRAEVTGMMIEELDLADAAWHLPADRAKTSTARSIYLCPMAVAILRKVIGERTSGPVLVAGRQGKALNADSLTTAVRRLREGPLKALAKDKAFTVHDFRRSAATGWGEHLDARPELIDRMLGHARRNPIEAAYQHQTYERQQRATIAAWGALITDHVAADPGENVTPFRRAATARPEAG